MYAKFVNRHKILPFTEKAFTHEGRVYVNPTPQVLKKAGFLPLLFADQSAKEENTEKIYMKDGTRILVSGMEKEETP